MRDSEAIARGKAKFEEVYPFKASENPTDFEATMYGDLFGDIYQRPGLSMRDRRLMIIGVAAAHGIDSILRLQLSAGLAKGDLKREDMDEITIFLTQYVGYPLGTRVRAAATEALKANSGA
ncbi:MAG: carboxymuconolactone decarboxylase family protein [Dehalococcoidia bacterium]